MNVLFTCVGRRTYLLKYFRENMSDDDRIIATDLQLTAPALQMADVKLQVPRVYDPNYVETVLNICKEYDIDAVISLNDLELPILANEKPRFEQIGVKVIVSDSEVIDICFDKYKTAEWLIANGFNTPRTYIDLGKAKKALKAGEIEYPVVMKPRWGSGSIGIEIAADDEELDIYYRLLQKKIKKSILGTASVGDDYILIQEMLQGDEFGMDVMNDLNGNNAGVAIKKKMAMRAGETDKAVTVDNEEIRQIGVRLGNTLKPIGNLDVDVMQRRNGDYCVLELNPRFGGGYPFSYEAGANMPMAILTWLKGDKVEDDVLKAESGKMFAKNDYLMEIK